jgi:hypothetical protein
LWLPVLVVGPRVVLVRLGRVITSSVVAMVVLGLMVPVSMGVLVGMRGFPGRVVAVVRRRPRVVLVVRRRVITVVLGVLPVVRVLVAMVPVVFRLVVPAVMGTSVVVVVPWVLA